MTITYFGYGSLVNTLTLGPQAVAEAGTLSGWRREWRAWWRPEGAENLPKICTLTVRRAADTAIRGVMVSEPAVASPLDVHLQIREALEFHCHLHRGRSWARARTP